MGLYTLITLILIIVIVSLLMRNHKLRQSQKHLLHEFDETGAILENLNDGLIECDRNMVIVRVNHVAEHMLGFEASEVVNRPISKEEARTNVEKLLAQVLFPPESNFKNEGQYFTYDLLLENPERKLRVFTIPRTNSSSGSGSSGKSLTGFIKIVRDVSIETVVEHHKNDLVSIVSHQLLTPLTGIKWIYKSILDGDGGMVTSKQAELLKKGLVASNETIDLVTDILDASKVEQADFAYKKVPHDIVALMREVVASRAEKASMKNIKIESTLPPQALTFNFDHERMLIAIENVLDNALDYSPNNSSVSVSLSSSVPSVISTDNNGKVVISITDHGIGISETDTGKLFAKFYRAENARRMRSSGTGLGLYLAKKIVEAHNGKISYISHTNEGSTFTIELPAL